jgi:hypothetical protein
LPPARPERRLLGHRRPGQRRRRDRDDRRQRRLPGRRAVLAQRRPRAGADAAAGARTPE